MTDTNLDHVINLLDLPGTIFSPTSVEEYNRHQGIQDLLEEDVANAQSWFQLETALGAKAEACTNTLRRLPARAHHERMLVEADRQIARHLVGKVEDIERSFTAARHELRCKANAAREYVRSL